MYCIGADSDDSSDSIISVTLILLVEATSLTNNNRHGFKVLPVTLNMTDWRWQLSCTWGKIRLVATEVSSQYKAPNVYQLLRY